MTGRFRHGQWHVHDYQGWSEQFGTSTVAGRELRGRANITNSEHLQRLNQQCDANLKTFSHNIASARSTLPLHVLRDTPVVQRGSATELQCQIGSEPIEPKLMTEPMHGASVEGHSMSTDIAKQNSLMDVV